jgi:hypothetical protein
MGYSKGFIRQVKGCWGGKRRKEIYVFVTIAFWDGMDAIEGAKNRISMQLYNATALSEAPLLYPPGREDLDIGYDNDNDDDERRRRR